MYEIYTYTVEYQNRVDFISMNMFNKNKFITFIYTC